VVGPDDEQAPKPSTSLIISTRNRPRFVVDVVRSVLSGQEAPTEIVVVDQSDLVNNDLARWSGAEGAGLRYLWGPARGVSRGRNAGIAASRGQVLVFLDDDMLVPAEWFGRIVARLMAANRRTVVTGRVVGGEPEVPGAFAPSLSLANEGTVYRDRPGRDVLLPMNMALHRTAVEEVGLFDVRLGVGTRFPSSEDNDFGFRLLEAGYEVIYDPAVVVVHRAWRGPGALVPLRWAYGRGQGAYFSKHASHGDRYMWDRLRLDVERHLRRARRRLTRQPKAAAADVVYGLGVLVGAVHWRLSGRPDDAT
jgi:GT2 family glycosyltransferase